MDVITIQLGIYFEHNYHELTGYYNVSLSTPSLHHHHNFIDHQHALFFSPPLRLCNTLPSITVVVVDVGSGHLEHCTLILLMRRCSSSSSICTLNTQNYCLTISRDFSTRTSNTSTISWRESSGRRSAVSSLLLLLLLGAV